MIENLQYKLNSQNFEKPSGRKQASVLIAILNHGDFIESQAFAYLAIRSFLKMPISFPKTTGTTKPNTGGDFIKFK